MKQSVNAVSNYLGNFPVPQPIVQFIVAPLGLFVGAIALRKLVAQSIAALVVMSTAGAVTALVLQRVDRRLRQKASRSFHGFSSWKLRAVIFF